MSKEKNIIKTQQITSFLVHFLKQGPRNGIEKRVSEFIICTQSRVIERPKRDQDLENMETLKGCNCVGSIRLNVHQLK